MMRKMRAQWRQWRLRPGLLYAAQCVEETAWSNKDTWALGPELNLISLAKVLREMADRHARPGQN